MHRMKVVHALFDKPEAGGARQQPFVRLIQASLHRRRASPPAAQALALRLANKIDGRIGPGKQSRCGETADRLVQLTAVPFDSEPLDWPVVIPISPLRPATGLPLVCTPGRSNNRFL
jgi:hypothetical protein